jgi:SHS2 domain-containing protein
MEEAFANSALGMMSLMIDTDSVRPVCGTEIKADGRDWKSLLVSWLGEILFLVEAEHQAFGEFSVTSLSRFSVRGRGLGEPLDSARHAIKREIKAPTYHMLELKEENGRWMAQIIFDV